MKLAGQVTAIALLCIGPASIARENPRLLVLDLLPGEGGPVPEEVRAASARLWEALGERSEIESWTAEVLARELSRLRPAGLAGTMERALSLVAQGREALKKPNLERAADDFQSALVLLREKQAFLDDSGPLIQAWLGLGEALLMQKRLPDAREAFQQALSLAPGYEPEPSELSERSRKVFESVREATAGQPGGWLRLESTPSGARVEVDGFRVGETPLRREFPVGLHALRLEAPDHVETRQVMEIAAGAETALSIQMKPLAVKAAIAKLEHALRTRPEDPHAAAGELLTLCDRVVIGQLLQLPSGERRLVLAVISASGSERMIFDWAPGGEAAKSVASRVVENLNGAPPAPQNETALDFSASYLGRVSAPPVTVVLVTPPPIDFPAPREPHPAPIPGPTPPPAPWWKTWWFWSATGGAVAVTLAVSLAIGLSGDSRTVQDPDTIRITVQRNP
ncbi:MAG: PEGA domain-containing protein [Myxococcales bacterium]|nr:PEGA domain-containing protein [Myxococcales bacterium]